MAREIDADGHSGKDNDNEDEEEDMTSMIEHAHDMGEVILEPVFLLIIIYLLLRCHVKIHIVNLSSRWFIPFLFQYTTNYPTKCDIVLL